MDVMKWLSSLAGGQDKKSKDDQHAVSAPNESSIEDYLRSGQASPSFVLLADDVKEKLVAKVMQMPRELQADILMRMQTMGLDELIEFATGEHAPPKAAAQRNYTVNKGDSLSKIAKAHQISVKDLVEANPQIENPDLIYPKQVINLPAAAGEASA